MFDSRARKARSRPAHEAGAPRPRDERHAAIRVELLERIREVCLGMPDELFLELIEAMAELELKYELRDGPAPK